MKNILSLFLLWSVISKPAEMPPQPPKGKALQTFGQVVGQEAETKKSNMNMPTLLESLPAELRREILRIISSRDGVLNVDALAKNILNLSHTNKALRAQINNLQNMLTLLNSLPRPAAIYLVEKLAQLPVIQENMLEILSSLPLSGAKYLEKILANTPGMKRNEVKEWRETVRLVNGPVLFDAVKQEDVHIVAHLLENPSIDVNWRDDSGMTALMTATFHGYTEIVRLLLAAGANVNIKVNDWTPLLEASRRGRLDIIKLLVAAGANLDAKNHLGDNALTIAVANGQTETVEFLLSIGMNVNAQNNKGETALMEAAYTRRARIVEILLAAGADVSIKDKSRYTALDVAREELRHRPDRAREYNEIIQILEEALKGKSNKQCSIQ
jgi:ankyrin repeat protein